MGPGGPFMGRREKMIEQLKEPKPQSIREVPSYIYRVVTKFIHRLFYIFKINIQFSVTLCLHGPGQLRQ